MLLLDVIHAESWIDACVCVCYLAFSENLTRNKTFAPNCKAANSDVSRQIAVDQEHAR